MALLLALVCTSVVSMVFIYLYINNLRRYQQSKHQVKAYQFELENIKKSENQLQAKLRHAMEDPLTELLGWQLFEDRLNQSIQESARYQLTIGVLVIDIDDFKVINHALSHQMGDELLRVVAKRIQTCVRQVDSVTRFTKDTFYVLLTQLGKPETAAIVAKRILQTLEQAILINGHELYVTACIGIAIYPTDGEDTQALIRSADYALHIAKEKGNETYQFYHERTHANSQRELILSTGLRRDGVFQEFIIYYQPIMDVQSNKIIGMDTLLYWQHPTLGFISPQELFSYAEKQGKLNVIAEWLLNRACKQFLAWRQQDFTPAFLGIPLSFKQLENSQFIYHISHILQELQFNPAWLLFEMKEQTGQLTFEMLEKAFNMLKYLHINLALDDFGMVPFSLQDFKNFTVHFLKLDSAFVNNLENPKVVGLIHSVQTLAKNLSMQLVIKGVETKEQLAILKELGCTLMQGEVFGAVISEKDMAAQLNKKWASTILSENT